MDLAILTGHGPPGLLERDEPPLEPDAVVLLGHRPDELHADVAARMPASIVIHALTRPRCAGAAPPARAPKPPHGSRGARRGCTSTSTSSTKACCPPSATRSRWADWNELVALVGPLVAAPNLLGVSVADFNPDRDADGTHASRVVDALESICGS